MIFKEIDFHIERYEKIDAALNKGMRLRMNHIIDSIFLRMPKKLKTDSIKKLNCYACAKPPNKDFVTFDGYCMAYVYYPNAYSISQYEDELLVLAVKNIITEGLKIALKYDSTLKPHLSLLFDLINSSADPFEYNTGVKRFHRSRKYKCEGVLRIQPQIYSSMVRVTNKAGDVEWFHVKDLEPLLFKPDLGFNKLLWEEDKIVAYQNDNRKFEFVPKMIGN